MKTRLLERLALLRVRPAPALGHVHGKGCYFGVLAPSALSVEGSAARQDKPEGQEAQVSADAPATDRPGSFDGSAVDAK